MRLLIEKPTLRGIEQMIRDSVETLYLEGIEGLSKNEIGHYLGRVFHSDYKDRNFVVIAGGRGSLKGMAVAGDLPWDSRILKRNVAKINLIVTNKNCSGRQAIYRTILEGAMDLCRKNGTDIIFFRSAADNGALNRLIVSMGSESMSIILNMYCPVKANIYADRNRGPGIPVRIRKPERSEYGQVEALMTRGYSNRLLSEPLFEECDVRNLYREWIRNDLKGRVKEVLIAETDGQIAGFVAFDKFDIGRKSYGFIDMIVVHERFRKRGIGKALMVKAADRLCKNTRGTFLSVECDKKEAVRFYESLGFRVLNKAYTFHIKPGASKRARSSC